MTSSPLKWHGGKSYLASKIVALMPPTVHYCEPYAGGLSVLFARDPEGTSEVVNDIDRRLMNFWGVLAVKEVFEEFHRFVMCVPFSEDAWNGSEIEHDDPVMNAAKFFVNCRQSLAGRMKDFATLSRNRVRRGMNEQASAWLSAVDGLPEVHARLRRVVVLSRPALDVIRTQDGANTLFYMDPPYLPDTRVTPDVYAHEMTVQDHRDLLAAIKEAEGKVMISGYPSELYDTELATWTRHVFDLPNNASHSGTKERKSEVVWCNF